MSSFHHFIIRAFYQSDWACLLANTSEGKPHQNKSLIVVPMDAKGITKSAISKMGMHVRLLLVKPGFLQGVPKKTEFQKFLDIIYFGPF